jgi:Rieske Fe-S protein
VANGNDSQHVPPPSLWPVGFALGVVCILVGVVVSWPAAAVGAGVAIVFGFLWARDVMGTHRAAAFAATAGPDEQIEAPPAPAQAGGPAMPESSAAEIARFPRSKFLEGATLGVGGLIGGAVTVPAVGLMVVPAFVKQGHKAIDLGPLGDFPEGDWVIATFLLTPKEGEVSRRAAYVRNNGIKDGKPSFTIISNRCAHLGCPVQPGGLVQSSQAKTEDESGGQSVKLTPVLGLSSFTCPCHGGSYDDEGNRVAGPPVRGLDRYQFSIVDGHLLLGNAYSVRRVVGKGADARITKYQLSGPGQHLDGLEGWLYPLQPPH